MDNEKNRFIDGNTIYLRGYEDSDIDRWYKWFNNAETTAFMEKRRFPNSYAKQKEFLETISASPSDIQLAIVHKKSDELIGTVGLHRIDFINRNADLSIFIGETRYWGMRLGKQSVP